MSTDPQPSEPPVERVRTNRDQLRASLLSWYDGNGRRLPWRVRGGRPDPYKVWLSEVMLQQTTSAAAGPYYERFLEKFPTLEALAEAPIEAALEAWAGLGYYSRARNLHAAAIALDLFGFPETEEGWRALPGVGPYTAAAVTAIALDQPANVVDGNVERVMARLCAVETPLPAAKRELREIAGLFVTAERPGDYAQAIMDLGALVCTPQAPRCMVCPWAMSCAARATADPAAYPRRALRPERPERFGAAFLLEHDGAFWLVRRPDKGLLGGMAGLPTTPWRDHPWTRADLLTHAPPEAGDWRRAGSVRQVFTHFALTLEVWRAAARGEPREGWWAPRDQIGALPAVFRKAADLVA